MRRIWRWMALGLLLSLPSLAAATWTCWPAGAALVAMLRLDPVVAEAAAFDDPDRSVELRLGIQRHFLDHSVYVPLEDIVVASTRDAESGATSLLMQRACGRGRLYVWIPLKFRLPALGEKVVEWCLRPRTKDR